MSTILDIWRNLKFCKSKILLNKGLSDTDIKKNQKFVDKYISEELLEILKDSNGQTSDSEPLFFEFKNNILGISFSYYNFLSLCNIEETYDFIQNYSKGKINTNLIPFAEIDNMTRDKGTIVFTIHNLDKIIYKTFCFTNDSGYVPVSEFRSEKFAKDMNEFLENQILWNSLKMGSVGNVS